MRWPIYIINSVNKTKLSCNTPTDAAPQFLYKLTPFIRLEFFFTFTRQIQKVHIGHDSKGRNKGVFVEEIEVTAPDAPKVIFPCRCWLAENEDDGKTARVIVPGESLTQPYDSK